MPRRIAGTAAILATLLLLTSLPLFADEGGPWQGAYLPLAVLAQATDTPTPIPPPAPTPPPTTITDGGFEQGRVNWRESSKNGFAVITNKDLGDGFAAHTGQWYAWLGGSDDEQASITQPLLIPNDATLTYWTWRASQETSCTSEDDVAGVVLNFGYGMSEVVDSFPLCGATNTGGWVRRTVDLTPYDVRVVELIFVIGTDSTLNSNWFIDDVALGTSPGPTATPAPTDPPSNQCDASYPTVCIPSPPPDLDCPDIGYKNFTVRPPDPHNFDTDHDGIGCETHNMAPLRKTEGISHRVTTAHNDYVAALRAKLKK